MTAEVGQDKYVAVATALVGEQRERCWTKLKEDYPFFASYVAITTGLSKVDRGKRRAP